MLEVGGGCGGLEDLVVVDRDVVLGDYVMG